MASSGLTRKDMSQMFKKIGWRRKEEAPPPQAAMQVSVDFSFALRPKLRVPSYSYL